MGLRDTLDNRYSIIMLDKPRIIKITMRGLLLLEDIYGTVGDALDMMRNTDDSISLYRTIVDFLYATVGGLTRAEIESFLTKTNIIEAHTVLLQALTRDMPTNEDGKSDDSRNKYDWDVLYFCARYRLLMSDDEFINCTPRRFSKLMVLWDEANGIGTKEEAPKEYYVDELPW